MATPVPTHRLLFWSGFIGLPSALFSTLIPDTAFGLGAGLTLFLLLALADGLRGPKALTAIRVNAPEVCRLSVGRQANLDIGIHHPAKVPVRLRIGLPFPDGVQVDRVDRWIEVKAATPNETGYSICRWPLKGLKRGRYFLERIYLESRSPLGLWGARTALPVRIEIRVYPGIGLERRTPAGPFLNPFSGIHARRLIGKGRDFEQLRDYVSGDGYEDIHWKATAKRRHPVTKIYQVERTRQIYAVIDASRMSCRRIDPPVEDPRFRNESAPSVPATVLDRYITAALVLGSAAERQGDQFGLITFDDRVRTFLRARSGKAHQGLCLDRLCTLDPRPINPDFNELFTFIATRIRRRALLVFLTHLDDPVLADGFISGIDPVRRRHLVMVHLLRSPSARPLFSEEPVDSTEALYERLGGQMLLNSLRETGSRLHRLGIQYLLTSDERMCDRLVSRYAEIKRRQIL